MFKCYPHCARCSSENFLYSICAESVLTGMPVYRVSWELLGYFKELSGTFKENPGENFHFGTRKDIKIEQKTLFWKTWFECLWIYYMRDLLSKDGKLLSLEELNEKFRLKVNYLQYFQITAAIPSSLKQSVLQTPISGEAISKFVDVFSQRW